MAAKAQAKAAGTGSDLWQLERLQPNPLNPRRQPSMDDPAIDEMALSIRQVGLLQPIVITPAGVIIAGHRRAVACRLAELDPVPVVVRDLDERSQLLALVIENVHREALDAVEMARAYRALGARGLSIAEIAERVGFAAQTVSRHLDILALPTELHEHFATCRLPIGAAPILMRLKTPSQRLMVGRVAAERNWLIAEIKAAVEQQSAPVPTPAAAVPATHRAAARPEAPIRPVAAAAPSPPAPAPAPAAPAPDFKSPVRQQATPKQACIDLFCDLTARLRRDDRLARDPDILDWLRRVYTIVRAAEPRAS